MAFTPLTEQLIEALQVLPGVGSRSAQRMALQLLERDRDGAEVLRDALAAAVAGVQQCQRCRALSESDLCSLCADEDRDHSVICVVETPADREAIELSGGYRGGYFILQGHLSPIDGIGPEELGIGQLLARIQSESIREVVLATNATMEGEATAHYLIEQLEPLDVTVSRIARGVPGGGELGRVESGALSHAMAGRKQVGLEHD